VEVKVKAKLRTRDLATMPVSVETPGS